MRITVASRNSVKLAAVRAVAAEMLEEEPWVIGMDAPPDLPAQPLSDEETIAAALRRARAARGGNVDYGVGIEGGVMRLGDRVYGCNWAAVVRRDGEVGLASSARYPLPPGLWKPLASGSELADLLESGIGAREGAVSLVSGGFVTRRHLAEEALRLAFGELLHPLLLPQPFPSGA